MWAIEPAECSCFTREPQAPAWCIWQIDQVEYTKSSANKKTEGTRTFISPPSISCCSVFLFFAQRRLPVSHALTAWWCGTPSETAVCVSDTLIFAPAPKRGQEYRRIAGMHRTVCIPWWACATEPPSVQRLRKKTAKKPRRMMCLYGAPFLLASLWHSFPTLSQVRRPYVKYVR